jgi:transposase
MSVRLLLTDEAWAELAPILATLKSRAGSPPALSDRLCIEAVLYRARTGIPWRDLPEDFGHWDAVYNRLRRWERRGIWRRLWERLHTEDCPLTRALFLDATIVRAHPHAAGALQKNGGPAAQALGRSRGGLSTKIHAGWRDARPGVARVLTAGQWHESPVCATGLAQVPPEPPLTHAIMDKGYDSNAIRAQLLAHDMVPGIPSKSNRTAAIDYDHDLYRLREKVERFCNKLKQFRCIATRYETLSQTLLALIHLGAAWIIIK